MTVLRDREVGTVVLPSSAARTCPVKTQNAFDPRLQRFEPAGEGATEWFDGGQEFRSSVLQRWAALPGVADLRALAGHPSALRGSGAAAVAAGAPVLLGWPLPADVFGHRTGRPDALVRGADTPDGRPGYHPVVLKWHKITERERPARPDRPRHTVRTTTLADPGPDRRRERPGWMLRTSSREADFLQLAHYQRMLEAARLAPAGPATGAVIGTDDRTDPFLAWADLGEAAVRTFSRSESEGWKLRSLLERYDHEHTFRVDIAERAARQSGRPDDPDLLVGPVVNDECGRCQWWAHCRPQLGSDDVSLRIEKGPLDAREILTLRRFGVWTITDLADADLEVLGADYLPEVRHRPGAATRLRIASRRARMLLDGVEFDRETTGDIPVTAAAVEVDIDVESSADGRIYLWGFLVDDGDGHPVRRQFARFADLDDATETDLAVQALGWLRALVTGSDSTAVYHYSGYEVSVIQALAARSGDEATLQWAAAYASESFVDLLEIVKAHYFGVAGLGLKSIARHAGFRWRDDDPGGLNSQRWFTEAVHADEPAQRDAARQRVLEYNEDDVIATHHLRAWLRAR